MFKICPHRILLISPPLTCGNFSIDLCFPSFSLHLFLFSIFYIPWMKHIRNTGKFPAMQGGEFKKGTIMSHYAKQRSCPNIGCIMYYAWQLIVTVQLREHFSLSITATGLRDAKFWLTLFKSWFKSISWLNVLGSARGTSSWF